MTKTVQRARSRLQQSSAETPAHRRPARSTPSVSLQSLSRYFRFLPLLLLAGVSYAGLYWLLTSVRPDQVKSLLLPNSFLPFHVLLLLGNFFLFTFLTLSKRWGIFIALAIEWLVFLRLQDVIIDVWAVLSALILGGGGWYLRRSWKNRSANL